MMRWTPLLAIAGVVLSAANVQAVPRFSARYRQNCSLCHQNPTGGGMRSLYASQYLLPTEMTMKKLTPEQIQKIKPNLSESVTVGADLRTIHFWSDDARAEGSNFFQMEGDAYLNFQAGDRFFAYLDYGQSRAFELFGAAFLLPWNGYVKFGRFTPDFGWRFEDHTHFTREIVVRQPPQQTDAGVEIGASPGRGSVSVAALNGAPESQLYDNDNVLAFAYRAFYRIDVGPVGAGAGGSYYTNSSRLGRQRAGGPIGYLDWWRFTWLGEADWSEFDPRGAEPVTLFTSSHELTFQAVRGFDLLATFDYTDPDIDRKTGIRVKYGAGADVLVTPFVGIRGTLALFRDEDRGTSGRRYTQSQVQVHISY